MAQFTIDHIEPANVGMSNFASFGQGFAFFAIAFQLGIFAIISLMMPYLRDLEDLLTPMLVMSTTDQKLVNFFLQTFDFLKIVLTL